MVGKRSEAKVVPDWGVCPPLPILHGALLLSLVARCCLWTPLSSSADLVSATGLSLLAIYFATQLRATWPYPRCRVAQTPRKSLPQWVAAPTLGLQGLLPGCRSCQTGLALCCHPVVTRCLAHRGNWDFPLSLELAGSFLPGFRSGFLQSQRGGHLISPMHQDAGLRRQLAEALGEQLAPSQDTQRRGFGVSHLQAPYPAARPSFAFA